MALNFGEALIAWGAFLSAALALHALERIPSARRAEGHISRRERREIEERLRRYCRR